MQPVFDFLKRPLFALGGVEVTPAVILTIVLVVYLYKRMV